jgi:hypothetical protein
VVGRSGTILRSSNGLDWTAASSGVSSSLYGVASDGNTIVVVGALTSVLTSADGSSWSPVSSGSSDVLYGVIASDFGFVAAGASGSVVVSPDGSGGSWTEYPAPMDRTLFDDDLYTLVERPNSILVAGEKGTILESFGNQVPAYRPTFYEDLADTVAVSGDPVTLEVLVAGLQPFSYQWQKNGVDIVGATGSSYQIVSAALSDEGVYRVRVSNEAGSIFSSTAELRVGNPPNLSFINPANGSAYKIGDTVSIVLDGSDDGSITSVEVFANGVSVGSGSALPMQVDWVTAEAATVSLTAVATDDEGFTGAASAISIAVNGPDASSTGKLEVLNLRRAHSDVSDGFYNNGSTTTGNGMFGFSGNQGSSLEWRNFMVIDVGTSLDDIAAATAITLDWQHSWNNNQASAKNLIVEFLGAFDTSDTAPTDNFMRQRYEQDSGLTQVETYAISGQSLSAQFTTDVRAAVQAAGANATQRYLWFRWRQSAPPDTDVTVVGAINNTVGTAGDDVNELSLTLPANQAPGVSLASSAATVLRGEAVTLTASATDVDGNMARVEFFANGAWIGTDATAPYSISWNVTEGVNSLTARAYDDAGASEFSAAVLVEGLTPFANWQVGSGISGALNESTDGIPNLIAYGMDIGDVADRSALLPTGDPDSGWLEITFRLNELATDLDWAVEASSDLSIWNTVWQYSVDGADLGGPVTEVNDLGSVRTLKVRDTEAISENQIRFMRVKITSE